MFRNSIVLLLCLTSYLVLGQSIYGTVSNQEKEELVGANVILYEQDSVSFLSYAITGGEGNWEIAHNVEEEMILKISYVGYETTILSLTDSLINQESIAIQLQRQAQSIDQVVVQAFDIVTAGDTISYRADAFRRKNDQTLGDILDNMPGIEVDNSGNIMYKGKRIDKLLIEGKDILNDQHKLTTKGFQADDIENIHIVENYKPFDQQYLPFSTGKVAMDIELTDEAKKSVQGDAELLGGDNEAYQMALNTYRVREKSGLTAFVRSNNINKEVISQGDFLTLQGNFMRTLNETGGDFSQIIPEGFNSSSDVQETRDNVLLINYEHNFEGGNTIRVAAMGNYSDRSSTSSVERLFSQTNGSINGVQQKEVSFPYIYSKVEANLKSKNKKRFFVFELPFYSDLSDSEQFYEGEIAQSGAVNTFRNNQNKLKLAPEIRLTNRFNDNQSLSFTTTGSYEQNNRELDNQQEFAEDVNQRNEQTNNTASTKLKYSIKGKELHFETSLGYSYFNQDLLLASPTLPSLNADLTHQVSTPNAEAKVRYEKNKWMVEPVLRLKQSNHELADSKVENTLFNSSINIRYQFRLLHFLLLSGSFGQNELPYYLTNNTSEFINENILRNNSLPLGSFSDDAVVNLSHFLLERAINFRAYTNISLNRSEGSLFQNFTPENDFFVQNYIQNEQQNGFNFLNTLFWEWEKVNLKFNVSTNIKNNELQLQDDDFNTEQAEYSQGIGVEYEPKDNIDIGYKFNYRNGSVQSQSIDQTNQMQTHGLNFTISSNTIRFNSKARLVQLDNTNISNSNYGLDAGLDIQLKKNWSIKVGGNELLNLSPQEIVQTTVTPFYFETIQYQHFQGTVTVGFKKLF